MLHNNTYFHYLSIYFYSWLYTYTNFFDYASYRKLVFIDRMLDPANEQTSPRRMSTVRGGSGVGN